MEKVVLKPGDVIPEKAVFDSASVNGDGELVGISVYMPEPKPKQAEHPDLIILVRDGEPRFNSLGAEYFENDDGFIQYCGKNDEGDTYKFQHYRRLLSGEVPTKTELWHVMRGWGGEIGEQGRNKLARIREIMRDEEQHDRT